MHEVDTRTAPEAETGGVVIGLLLGLDEDGYPLVSFPGAGTEPLKARSTVELDRVHIGRQVALMFERGDIESPVVIGRILVPSPPSDSRPTASVDNERLVFDADQEIVLNCGHASITLTRAGKIILRGKYVLSRSSGVNKIKGGSVQIN